MTTNDAEQLEEELKEFTCNRLPGHCRCIAILGTPLCPKNDKGCRSKQSPEYAILRKRLFVILQVQGQELAHI